ncbi:hypothetical protein Zm00014a_038889 [Zea mays]|uniref:ATP-dependent DNA helicase n=1 Tax=Zea mays TaxID=4577 RepID=A0A3L6F4I6_MAIZE|nr:hypothetical protein Zm00014a_038889 [Zea mays]
MIHGPCGALNPNSQCMKNNRCSKNYPKEFHEETNLDEQGFATYRRRNNDRYVIKGGHKLDNRWVVPYNDTLLKTYQAHINVEWCNKTVFVKYLFKYVTKGPDYSKVYLQRIRNGEDTPYDEETNARNEVKEYLDTRYLCDKDSYWRVLGYDIHRHYPAVERMPVHLPNENYITYNAASNISRILSKGFVRKTMLTEWFYVNSTCESARDLTYIEFPTKWRWEDKTRSWKPRHAKEGKIGRIYYVHPSTGERYYLRMLLMIVKGATSYEDLRRYNNILHPTFKEACRARGLLNDDNEWYNAFDEAARWATSEQLRHLFVTMLLYCEVGDEYAFFEKVWKQLTDDIQYRMRKTLNLPSYQMPTIELRDHLIDKLSVLFNKCGSNIKEYNLPQKTNSTGSIHGNRFIEEELSYNFDTLSQTAYNLRVKLNDQQLHAFNTIVDTVLSNIFGFFFLSGYGGTRKTFLWNAIITHLRAQKRIVLTVASSGVASLLLPGGRTAHSRFRIPCELDETSTCDIKRGTMLAELIEAASLIIWDGAFMTHRNAFEALDRSLRDLLSLKSAQSATIPFGGKVIILGGDPRQILPVIEGGNRAQIINAAITNSPLWNSVTVLHLTQNMRLRSTDLTDSEKTELADFSAWILNIGNGNIPAIQKPGEMEPTWIQIPSEFLLLPQEDHILALIATIYPEITESYNDPTYLQQRAVLTPTNEIADLINEHVVDLIPGTHKQYLSCDWIAS